MMPFFVSIMGLPFDKMNSKNCDDDMMLQNFGMIGALAEVCQLPVLVEGSTYYGIQPTTYIYSSLAKDHELCLG